MMVDPRDKDPSAAGPQALLDSGTPAPSPASALAAEDDPFAAPPSATPAPADASALGRATQPPASALPSVSAAQEDAPSVTSSAIPPGTVIDHYVVDSKVGGGGMGEVYLARDTRLQRPVAIKVMKSALRAEKQFTERFATEALLPAAISHPNIIAIYDRGTYEDSKHSVRDYIVMEYVPGGQSFADAVHADRKKLMDALAAGRPPVFPPVTKLHSLFLQLAAGLQAIHASKPGVWHRDLKLANVMVQDLPGGGWALKIIDFGIAHTPTANLTMVGDPIGTPSYMSPEHFEFANGVAVELDHRSDLFALGIVMYQAITLEHPWPSIERNKERQAFFAAALHSAATPALPPSHHRPDLPRGLDYVVMKLLERDRTLRYQSAADVMTDLGRLLELPEAYVSKSAADLLAENSQFRPAPPPSAAAVRAATVAPGSSASRAPVPLMSPSPRPPTPAPALAVAASPSSAPPAENAAWAAAWKRPPDAARRKAGAKLAAAAALAVGVFAVMGGLFWALDRVAASRQAKLTPPAAGSPQWPGEPPKPNPDAWVSDVRNAEPLYPTGPGGAPAAPRPSDPQAVAGAPAAEPSNVAPAPAKATHRAARHAGSLPAGGDAPSPAPAAPAAPAAAGADAWQQMYGSAAAELNTGALTVGAGDKAGGAAPAAKGVRLAARLVDNAASQPAGAPVVAKLTAAANLGGQRLPLGTEIHGRTTSSQGLRVFVAFEFLRLPDGTTVPISAVARGTDGRPGVPGERTLGSGAAGSVATTAGSALIRETAGKLANAAGDALGSQSLREAAGDSAEKAKRLDPSEDLVLAKRGTNFVVYVESITQPH
jgi:serine/threonine-protein kinase